MNFKSIIPLLPCNIKFNDFRLTEPNKEIFHLCRDCYEFLLTRENYIALDVRRVNNTYVKKIIVQNWVLLPSCLFEKIGKMK